MKLLEYTQVRSLDNTFLRELSGQNAIRDTERQIIEVVNYIILCSLVSLFGIVTNIMNLVVFLKQGLNSTINISFFALAISDLSSLILQQWFSICVNPLFQQADILIVPSEIQYMTGGVPRVACGRITFLITVYITAERCLCVAFPLHVKQMITPKRTTFIICGIYFVTIFLSGPIYYANRVEWKFYPERNKSLLGLVPTADRDTMERIVYFTQFIFGIISFVVVVAFTCILISKLREKSNWRNKASVNTKHSTSMSNRDTKTVNLVVLIAGILIICNTPGELLFVATFLEPELSAAGRYSNLFFAMWSFGFLFEAINSSVNIFLYIKMSSKFRDTFRTLFPSCLQDKLKEHELKNPKHVNVTKFVEMGEKRKPSKRFRQKLNCRPKIQFESAPGRFVFKTDFGSRVHLA